MTALSIQVLDMGKHNRLLAIIFGWIFMYPLIASSQSDTCAPVFKRYTALWNNTNLGTFLGGDAAYSVRMGSRTLWFFGDSFLSFERTPRDRTKAQLIPNIVAISECDSKSNAFDVAYHWKFSEGPGPLLFEPIFKPVGSAAGLDYWPGQPWFSQRRLFVPLHLVKRTTTGIGFEIVGMHVARVNNPQDVPALWDINYLPLFSEAGTNFGQGVVVGAGYVFLFNGTPSGTTLARISESALTADAGTIRRSLEYLKTDNRWERGYITNRAQIIPLRADSGLTIRWLEKRQEWVALFVDFSEHPAKHVSVSFADSLISEWSAPQPIFTLPLPTKQKDDGNCYAAYSPRGFEGDLEEQIGFTYNCNRAWDNLLSDMSVYFPQFRVRALPKSD
jgi:hypothetical protein